MNAVTADTLRVWVDRLEEVDGALALVQPRTAANREHFEIVRGDLVKITTEMQEAYFAMVRQEVADKPHVLPFRIVSVPQGSNLKCPSEVVNVFAPDVPGAYIVSTVRPKP